MATSDTSVVKGFFDSSQKVTILLPSQPQFDAVAAALGLKLSLDSAGKSARVVCPDPMLVEFNRLVGVETVTSRFGNRNLIITFPNQTEHVDNISYNLENGILQLVVTPKSQAPDLDHKQLKFISATGKQDLVVTLGVTDLHQLGPVYDETREIFQTQTTPTVSVSHTPPRSQFGSHQLHDYDSVSLSEIIASLVDSLGMPLDTDSASNLLAGLEKSTDNFRSPRVSVTTFEVAAKLMRHGAKRAAELSSSDFPTGSIPQASSPPAQSQVASQPQPSSQAGFGTDGTQQPPTETSLPRANGKKAAPPDWYEPKIYKGPMLP